MVVTALSIIIAMASTQGSRLPGSAAGDAIHHGWKQLFRTHEYK